MSNQTNQTKENTNSSRRRAVQIALSSAPIIATLTSRPVQAVQGLSNMMSGNASDCRGDNFYGGMSPGFWLTPTPGVTQLGDSHAIAWAATGFEWGTLQKIGKPNQWQSYIGGTLYRSVFSSADDRPLRVVLGEDTGADHWHILAGLLNARYFENKAGGGRSLYFLTVDQFWFLYNNPDKVPEPYTSLRNMVEVNYHFGPNSDCMEVVS